MARKKEHYLKQSLHKSSPNKLLAVVLVVAFLLIGIFIIYKSFAGGVPVFKDNPDYWRPRIAQCESGTFYGNKKNPKYRGAYQYSPSTWGNYKGYADPADAPPEVQDERFYLSFAKSGTAPWSSSYSCWIKGATVPSSPQDQLSAGDAIVAVVAPPSPPAKPFGVDSGSYNVVINGRITLNDAALPGVVLNTCSADRTVTSDAEGRYSFAVPVGDTFCLRPQSGLPAGAILEKIANNVEHSKDVTFENQIAGVDCYKQFWCFLSPSYLWDRSRDAGYNFFFTTTPPTKS